MQVLFFEPYSLNIPHFGTCLELIIQHLEAGDEVWFLGCSRDFKACDINPTHIPNVCRDCRDRKREGLQLIRKYGEVNHLTHDSFLSAGEKAELSQLYRFNDIGELKQLSFEDFYDIGYAVASSIISIYRDPSPNTLELRDLINRYLYSSKLVYKTMDRVLAKVKPDRVYAHNGRYALIRPALRACEKHGIDIFLTEVGSDLTKYYYTKNKLLQDISFFQKCIFDFWNDSVESEDEKRKKAHSFYSLTKEGISKSWHSFTADQKLRLPVQWDGEKKNIVFFTTSEDEFAAIGDNYIPPLYQLQEHGIERIARDLEGSDKLQIWIRLHPNLKHAPEKLIAPYKAINSPLVKLIMPEEDVSSYLLMEKADKVFSFGSTMGIEAAYWGKVSVLLGPCAYRGMGSVYEPKSHKEAVQLALDENLKPLDNLGATKYGYFLGCYGMPFQHFKKTGIYTGLIKGWDFARSQKLEWINKFHRKGLINESIAETIFRFFK